MSPPMHTLHLSSLIWNSNSEPRLVYNGETSDGERLGCYVAGPDCPIVLGPSDARWSDEHKAYVYTPTVPSFMLLYERKAYVGAALSKIDIATCGALAGMHADGRTISPLLCLHLPGTPAFSSKLPKPDLASVSSDVIVKRGPGPPYDFFPTDWLHGSRMRRPARLRSRLTLDFDIPDLRGQTDDDAVLDHGDGWSGSWVDTLLDQKEHGSVSDSQTASSPAIIKAGREWAVEANTASLRRSNPDDDSDTEDSHISSYSVEAQILRIFVEPGWFEK